MANFKNDKIFQIMVNGVSIYRCPLTLMPKTFSIAKDDEDGTLFIYGLLPCDRPVMLDFEDVVTMAVTV